MFKKENLINLLIVIVILLILGAISIPLILDPDMGIVKKKDGNNIIMLNEEEQSDIQIIEEVNEITESE